VINLRRKRNTRTKKPSNNLVKVLAASLVLSPAVYMLPFDQAYVQAVTTISYKAPLVTKPLPDYRTAIGVPITLDLNQYFNGIGSYSATVSSSLGSSNLGFGAAINQNVLTFTNDRTGTATVTVTGTAANGGTVSDTFDVLVVPDTLDKDNNGNVDIGEIVSYVGSRPFTKDMLNEALNFIAPQKMNTPNAAPKSKDTTVTIYKNTPSTINPSDLFEDDETLKIDTFNLSSSSYATASLTNSQITFNALQHGSLSMDMSVSDGRGGTASNRYDVVVGNRAPVYSSQAVTVTQSTYAQVDLKTMFSDLDGDILQFGQVQVTQTGTPVQVAQTNDNLSIYGAAAGTATVTATANDNYGGTATGNFNVTVTAATYGGNHAPTVVSTITDKSTTIPIGAINIPNVGFYFTDVDGPGLTFEASSGTNGIITLALDSGNLKITPLSKGSDTVTLIAKDSSNATAQFSFNVTVANTVPVAGTINTQAVNPGYPSYLYLTSAPGPYFTDPDGDPITYSASSSATGVATVELTSSGQVLKIIPASRGTSTITLTATDSSNAATSLTFDAEVAGNNVPAYNNASNMLVNQVYDPTSPYPPATINLTNAFMDQDNDPISYSATSVGPSVASVTVSGNVLSVTPAGTPHGNSTITVTANDGQGGQATKDFIYTINKKPTFTGTLSPLSATVLPATDPPGPDQTVSVYVADNSSNLFKDEDTDSLVYTATSDSGDILTVTTSLNSGNTTRTAYITGLLTHGTQTVTITATDPFGFYDGGYATASFDIIVNTPPVSKDPVTIYVGASSSLFSVSDLFTDADEDSMMITSLVTYFPYVTVSLMSGDLSIRGLSAGTATVTVNVTDYHGFSGPLNFNVQVLAPS
jgi:hypothetical protein